jgi:hypothetical protein
MMQSSLSLLASSLFLFASCARADAPGAVTAPQPMLRVSVSIDLNSIETTSLFQPGVTHTKISFDTLENPNAEAVERARMRLAEATVFQNVHIMGWGTDNPNPAPGQYNWASLDKRMQMVASMPGAVPVITLCAAPDWMKGGQAGKTDWQRIEAAPLPEHFGDFAALAATIAKRYPSVRYFQVWNEMKGMWKGNINNWDFEGYTRLYNAVYDALKKVNPAIKVGGPYLVIEGTGGGKGPRNEATDPPLSRHNQQVLDYWLANKHGADFVCLDKALKSYHDPNTYTLQETMALTHYFGDVARQLSAKTDLPIWWSEYYADIEGNDSQATAAAGASVLAGMIRTRTQTALMWQPMATGEVPNALFSKADSKDGGRPLPYYDVFRGIKQWFGPGTPILKSTSSSPQVEVLASANETLLINVGESPILADVDGTQVALGRYDVRFIPTPRK